MGVGSPMVVTWHAGMNGTVGGAEPWVGSRKSKGRSDSGDGGDEHSYQPRGCPFVRESALPCTRRLWASGTPVPACAGAAYS